MYWSQKEDLAFSEYMKFNFNMFLPSLKEFEEHVVYVYMEAQAFLNK